MLSPCKSITKEPSPGVLFSGLLLNQRRLYKPPCDSLNLLMIAVSRTVKNMMHSSMGFVGRASVSRLARASFHTTSPKATTILCVRKNGKVCMMGDGMVSMGSMIVKPNAVKIRSIPAKGSEDPQKGTLVGFAGATADAFTLLERLEGKLDEYPGQLSRSCVELAKGWRTDKYLRRLEASLIVADENVSLQLTGNGDVLEMSDGVISVGSGSPYATGTLWVTATRR